MALLLRHRLPPPLPLLLIILVAASHGTPSSGDNYDPSMCLRQPQPCGNVSISYPFYLYNETGVLLGNSSSYCGYPGLGVMCDEDNEQAILQLGGHNYTVSNINYTDLTVSVVDQEVWDQEACPIVDHNVSLPRGLSYPYSTVDYLFFFLNCSFNTTVTKPPNIDPIRCEIFGVPTARLSFVLRRSDVPPGDWWQACLQVFKVPVLKYDLPALGDLGWTTSGYGSYLRSGFQFTWDQKPPACNQCEQSNGQCGYNQAGEFVGCLCSGRRAEPHTCSSGHKKRTIIYIAASLSCLLLLCLLIPVFFLTRKYGLLLFKSKDETRIKSFLQKNENLHPKRYTYAEVKRMTKSFAVKLGQGGFGVVYRGNLYDGRQVAVKMLKDSKGDGEFMNEVASISRTSHVNVVTLLGFCLKGSKRALIYEYMPNGSLERYAFNNSLKGENTLTWDKLFDIAIGIARGLEYLHRGCNTRIVHFDIKPHNILLDHDLCPKISDFGLAKLCLNKESGISMVGARGTIGYIAPEVYSKQFGTISSKSDVYSYGMMVLEMVGARDKNINANSESSSQYFPQWIYEHLDDYCISASEINGETTELVRKMIVIGLWCIQVISTDRPTMTRVVEMLEGSTSNLELPPKPLLS